MAPNTRQIDRFTPPPKPQSGGVPNTERRMKFFKAYDKDCKVKSFRAICRDEDEAESTARGWMTQRRNLGLLANRRTRKLSKRLGKPSKITPAMCRMLVDPKQNPVRNQLYDVQIEYHKLPVQKRQLQRKLREYTNGGRRYKMAFVKKRVSDKNRQERERYGWDHEHHTIDSYYSRIVFTDEMHIDPSSQAVVDILREQGTRYDDENIRERLPKEGGKFHVAGWVNWY